MERAAARAEVEELWPSVAGLLDQALRLVVYGGPGRRDRLVLARARARIGMRDVAGAAADVAEVMTAASARADQGLAVRGMVLQGEVERLGGQMEASGLTLGRAVNVARALGEDQVVADALRALGQTRLFAGDETGADDASTEALAAFRNLGDRRGEAWALQTLAWTAFNRGDFGPAEDRLRSSADAFSEIGDWGGHNWAFGLLGWVRFGQGRFDEAEDLGRSILRESAGSGDQWGTAMMTVLVANVTLWTGRTSEAESLARSARDGLGGIQDDLARTLAAIPLARALLALGRIDAGRDVLDELAQDSTMLTDPRMRRLAQGAVAIALTQQLGEGPTVIELARDLVNSAPEDVMPEQRAVLGVALLQAGRLSEGRAVLEKAVDTGPEGTQPNVGVTLALARLVTGDVDGAGELLDRHSGPGLGTYMDRAWAAVARGFVARLRGDSAGLDASFGAARAEVDATEDRLAQATVRLAHHVARPAVGGEADRVAVESHDRLVEVGVGLPGWERVFRALAGAEPIADPGALANLPTGR